MAMLRLVMLLPVILPNATSIFSVIMSYNVIWNATDDLPNGESFPTGISGLALRVSDVQGRKTFIGAGSRARVVESVLSSCGKMMVTSAVLLPARLALLKESDSGVTLPS